MVRLIRFINIKLFPVAPVKRKHGIGIFGGENAQYQMIVFVLNFTMVPSALLFPDVTV